jgi:DNA replication and repair protein RecF
MRLLSVELRDFRNVAQARIDPSPRATVLVGENGQGKTNVLEAVYFACTLKPLRASRLVELVRFGAERGLVAA